MRLFNTSDLVTGYIKQLLKNFNLPKIKIYTKKHAQYAINEKTESPEIFKTIHWEGENEAIARYFPYLRNGEIQEFIDNKWVNIGVPHNTAPRYYSYNQKILNYTKNLKINSNIYDSYTHEYLGDYLRFQRDFNDLDLMPLYNCFSDRACDKLKIKFDTNNYNVVFDSSDTNYKIYMIPVKLFQKYTIAIDSNSPIELCCGIYGDYQDTREKFNSVAKYTYKRITSSQFSKPILYDLLAITDDDKPNTLIENLTLNTTQGQNTLIELAQNEEDLKLFIKLPANNLSTIVILEGDYTNWNNSNKTIINLEHANKYSDLILYSPLQLLQFNTMKQHPFADRLIEYLLGNTIDNTDEIYDNVTRAQKALKSNSEANNFKGSFPGLWNPQMTLLFYEDIQKKNLSLIEKRDLLGYVDKTVEKYYNATFKTSTEKYFVSLSNIELEEGDK